jgi:hypothetical protein
MEQARKHLIEATAREHHARSIYENSICRSGLERSAYREAWQKAETNNPTPAVINEYIVTITADGLDNDLDGAANFLFRALCMQEF